MAIWLTRAGKGGENEGYALDRSVALIGWLGAGDLTGISDRGALMMRLRDSYPDAKEKTLINWLSQIWPFIGEIKPGDIVALPLNS